MKPALAPASSFAAHWGLDPEVAYLNHGSYGACPRVVLDRQAALRTELEREPVDFLTRQLPARLAEARRAIAPFVGADPDDLAFVANATSGVNAVLRSLPIQPGDELLTTDHVYGACGKALRYAAARAGAEVRVAAVPFPLEHEDQAVLPVLAAVTPRTRLALLDHVTSVTGLVFPLPRLVQELHARGVPSLVDGAHALGILPLDLNAIGADYYTANAHKWLCAPKGAAILHVRRERQAGLHPLVISHGYAPAGAFRDEFDWTGTADPTAWLCIPECIRFLGTLLPGGWPELMARNRALALEAREMLSSVVGAPPPCPPSWLGALASLPLPSGAPGSPAARLDADGLSAWFRERGIETWLHPWANGRVIRVSAQLYNSREQFAALAQMLREALA